MFNRPPPWLTAWKRMVTNLLHFGRTYVVMMVRAVLLGFMPRSWLHDSLPPHLPEHPNKCSHQDIKRYGNRHGRFAQCLKCSRKFKWNEVEERWEFNPLKESSQSSQLPVPSSDNTQPVVAVPTSKAKGRGKTRSKSSTTSIASSFVSPDQEQVELDLQQQQDIFMGVRPEEHQSMAETMYDFNPIFLPENRDELNRILARANEAAMRLNQSTPEAFQMDNGSFEEEYDWETSGG